MSGVPSGLPPAVLGDATWCGTLAAARDLGSRGVRVTIASDTPLAPACWSRHVARTVRCPSTSQPTPMLQWLLDRGQREPGSVLYPTSDELAWLLSLHRERLGAHYQLYSPSIEALTCLLDKHRLAQAAVAAGLCAPETWCPADEDEVGRVERVARFPLHMKPRTNVFGRSYFTAQRVEHPADLLDAWRSWQPRGRFPQDVVDLVPDLERPVLQPTYPGSDRIFTVDGFIDETGDFICTLGCIKTLQLPRGSGPGICFEAAPVPGAIEAGLARLFRHVGFHGVFDAEFLEHEGRYLLIDVNPRFYNHMAFEVERGLALPWLAYLAATGNREALGTAVKAARQAAAQPSGPDAYVHRLPLQMMLTMQALTGGMSASERERWRAWVADHHGRITDPVRQEGDGWPGLVEIALELCHFVQHPRSYLRLLTKTGSEARPAGRSLGTAPATPPRAREA